jgi:IS1 family transposase
MTPTHASAAAAATPAATPGCASPRTAGASTPSTRAPGARRASHTPRRSRAARMPSLAGSEPPTGLAEAGLRRIHMHGWLQGHVQHLCSIGERAYREMRRFIIVIGKAQRRRKRVLWHAALENVHIKKNAWIHHCHHWKGAKEKKESFMTCSIGERAYQKNAWIHHHHWKGAKEKKESFVTCSIGERAYKKMRRFMIVIGKAQRRRKRVLWHAALENVHIKKMRRFMIVIGKAQSESFYDSAVWEFEIENTKCRTQKSCCRPCEQITLPELQNPDLIDFQPIKKYGNVHNNK